MNHKAVVKQKGNGELTPKLRFPEFRDKPGWKAIRGDKLFNQINNRQASPGLPILAITQEYGAIPRDLIDYHVSVTDKSIETYKEVQPGDFIISLRSFQGGIEYSGYHGVCSPAYVVLRKEGKLSDLFFKQLFKSYNFIQQLTKNLEGLRDGKMISYKQFSELLLPNPSLAEQQKIADCLTSLDEVIAAQSQKLEALTGAFPSRRRNPPTPPFSRIPKRSRVGNTPIRLLCNQGLLRNIQFNRTKRTVSGSEDGKYGRWGFRFLKPSLYRPRS